MKVYIKTYGCQMNERDSDALEVALNKRGFTITDIEDEANIFIFNTCSIRAQAENKVLGKVGLLKRVKRERPDIIIGIIGCMAQRRKEELFKKLPHLDFIVGTNGIYKIPDIVEQELKRRGKIIFISEDKGDLTELRFHRDLNHRVSDFIAVMRGCDMFCSYCIVPYVRGREKSRNMSEIFDEAKMLAEHGVKEVILLGQNISAYGLNQSTRERPKESPLAELLKRINNIDGIERIRFISPHPFFVNDPLIEAMATLSKVCNNIHLPLQSGSDKILKMMNRRYDSKIYLDIVDKLKRSVENITFSTDIIVGFPGESEEDFNKTREIMQIVGFDNAYIFKFSPREGTAAVKYKDQIPQEVKEERNQILLKDLEKISESNHKAMEGKIVEVLVEGESKRNSRKWMGRTTTNRVVIFSPNENTKIGDIIRVRINRGTSMSLFGEQLL